MSQNDDCYGPALPPHLLKRHQENDPEEEPPSKTSVIGPVLPSNFQSLEPSTSAKYSSDSSSDSTDSEDVGPLPMDSTKVTKAQLELEERALEYQIRGIPSQSSKQREEGGREEWMLELPEVKKVADMGLTARQFKAKEGPDFSDRSSWTDTPTSKKEKKKQEGPSNSERLQDVQEIMRDKAMEKMRKKHEKKHKREKSLLEIHQDKLKKKEKKKKKKNEKPERRPFNRDTDLSANKFDEAKKKAALKSSQFLDDRFSSGNRKFL